MVARARRRRTASRRAISRRRRRAAEALERVAEGLSLARRGLLGGLRLGLGLLADLGELLLGLGPLGLRGLGDRLVGRLVAGVEVGRGVVVERQVAVAVGARAVLGDYLLRRRGALGVVQQDVRLDDLAGHSGVGLLRL